MSNCESYYNSHLLAESQMFSLGVRTSCYTFDTMYGSMGGINVRCEQVDKEQKGLKR